MTNMDKLTAWDAEFYNSLSDDVCIVCLSEKQVYLLGQSIRQMQWSTRWHGDISQIDLKDIAGELDYMLTNRDACKRVDDIYNQIINLQDIVYKINQDVINIKNDTNYNHYNGVTVDTVIDDNVYEGGIDDVVYTLPDVCSSQASKDALWGACINVAEKLVESATDFFEFVAQSTTGSEITDNIISAIPIIETLPFDEMAGLADWITDEARELWDATVNDDRIKDFACLLFCYASVYNNCNLSPLDIFSVINANAPSGSELIGKSIRHTVTILVAGNVIGNDLFYGVLAWQLAIRAAGQTWVGSTGMTSVKRWIAQGFNNPSSDWSIFCVDCGSVSYRRVYDVDFRLSGGDSGLWTINTGVIDTQGIDSSFVAGSPNRNIVEIRLETSDDEPFTVQRVQLEYERTGQTTNTGFEWRLWRDTEASSYVSQGQNNSQSNGIFDVCRIISVEGANNVGVGIRIGADEDGNVLLQRVKLWLSASSPFGTLTKANLPC